MHLFDRIARLLTRTHPRQRPDAWPPEVVALERFLTSAGLRLIERHGPDKRCFGNRYIRFANDDLTVQILWERGVWDIEIIPRQSSPPHGIPVVYFRQLFDGGEVVGLPLRDQADFVTTHWPRITAALSAENTPSTVARVDELRRAWATKTFGPSAHDARG